MPRRTTIPRAKPLRHRISRTALHAVLLFCIVQAPVAPAQAPIIVNDPVLAQANTSAYWSLFEERGMGEDMAYQLMREPEWTQDPLLDDYVQSLGQQLLHTALQSGVLGQDQAQQAAWRWYLIRDARIDAFAIPGGQMGLHLGLIAQSANAGQLAAVMAHELAHLFQRHIARASGNEKNSLSVFLATALLGALMAQKNSDAAGAVIAFGQGAAAQVQLNFSRDMERDADRIGVQLLRAAGYSAQDALDFFNTLSQAQRLNDNSDLPYLRSHPLTRERIADIQNLRINAPATIPSTAALSVHTLMAARAKVLAEPQTRALDAHIALAQRLVQTAAIPSRMVDSAQRASLLYAGSLAALLRGQANLALQLWQALKPYLSDSANPASATLTGLGYLLQLEIVTRAGLPLDRDLTQWLNRTLKEPNPQANIAAQWLAQASTPALVQPWLASAQHVLERGRYATFAALGAARAPQGQTLTPAFWAALARLYHLNDEPLKQLEALAAERAARYDYAGAIDRLTAALGQTQARQQEETQLAILASQLQTYRNLRAAQRAREQP